MASHPAEHPWYLTPATSALAAGREPAAGSTVERGILSLSGLSERVETGAEQAELVALGVGKNMPGLLTGLADVGRSGP